MVSEGTAGVVCCAASVGVLLVCLGVMMQAEKSKYTPLYQEIVCKPEDYNVAGVSFSPLRFDLGIIIACENPNPYVLRGKPWGSAKVFIDTDRTEVGSSTITPPAGEEVVTLPEADGDVVGYGLFTLKLSVGSGAVSPLLSGIGIGSDFEAYFELKVIISVEPTVLGMMAVTLTELTLDEKCGMTVRLTPAQTGDVACGSDFPNVTVAPIGDISQAPSGAGAGAGPSNTPPEEIAEGEPARDTEAQFGAFNVPPEEIRDGELARDKYCDIATIVCVLLGSVALAVPACVALHELGCGRKCCPSRPSLRIPCVTDPNLVGKPDFPGAG